MSAPNVSDLSETAVSIAAAIPWLKMYGGNRNLGGLFGTQWVHWVIMDHPARLAAPEYEDTMRTISINNPNGAITNVYIIL